MQTLFYLKSVILRVSVEMNMKFKKKLVSVRGAYG